MTTATANLEALIAAVIAAPEDDALRLVAADAFEDAGQLGPAWKLGAADQRRSTSHLRHAPGWQTGHYADGPLLRYGRDRQCIPVRCLPGMGERSDSMSEPGRVEILYQNHRGETSRRIVLPESITWGDSEWHPEEQYLLWAWCFERGAVRTFAMKDIREWKPVEAESETA